jgi:hypothetical protein
MLKTSENIHGAKVKELIEINVEYLEKFSGWVNCCLYTAYGTAFYYSSASPSRVIFVIILCAGPSSSYSKFYSPRLLFITHIIQHSY